MNRRTALFLLLFIFFATNLAADAGSIAMLVLERDEAKIDAALAPAIGDAAPLVRATAARVANVRNRTPLLDAIRTQLDRESDVTAAREEARAVIMLGGATEIDRALAASDRFEKRLDSAVAVAVARLGPDVAVPAYFERLRMRAEIGDFFQHVLWGHPDLRSMLASRTLGANDVRGFRRLLATLDAVNDVDPGILIVALRASPEFREAATLHILGTKASIDDRIRPVLADLPPATTGDALRLEDELLRRAARVPHQPIALANLLRDDRNAIIVRSLPVRIEELLTNEERKAMGEVRYGKPVRVDAGDSKPLPDRPFVLPSLLPEGLGEALLRESRCNAAWIGVVNVQLDTAGRVSSIDATNFDPSPPCRQAAEALLRLSLAASPRIGAPRRAEVLMLHARKPDFCLDEEAEAADVEAPRTGGAIKAPVVLHRVEPLFPEAARAAMTRGHDGVVIIECRISKKGCVSDVHLLKQTSIAALNASALLAVDEWTFKPGTLNGEPVDVIFNVLIHFKR